LLKSRAAINDIRYSRFADGVGGRTSYELEFADGGIAYVIGNIIEQSAQTENRHMIAFGMDGYSAHENSLFLVHNTLIDRKRFGGKFLRMRSGITQFKALNNLLVGIGDQRKPWYGYHISNIYMSAGKFDRTRGVGFAPSNRIEVPGGLADPGTANGVALQPNAQYHEPVGQSALHARPHNPGAIQHTGPSSGR